MHENEPTDVETVDLHVRCASDKYCSETTRTD